MNVNSCSEEHRIQKEYQIQTEMDYQGLFFPKSFSNSCLDYN